WTAAPTPFRPAVAARRASSVRESSGERRASSPSIPTPTRYARSRGASVGRGIFGMPRLYSAQWSVVSGQWEVATALVSLRGAPREPRGDACPERSVRVAIPEEPEDSQRSGLGVNLPDAGTAGANRATRAH